MTQKNGPAVVGELSLWDVWEVFTQALLRMVREECDPFARARLDEADAYLEDMLWTVKKAREEAAQMKADYPGCPAPKPVTPESA